MRTPALPRALRRMPPVLLIVVTLVAAGAVTLLVHRRDAREASASSRGADCSRALDEVFGADAATTPDSVLLDRLLVHRDRCIGDAEYVDQARRLMLNLQRTGEARGLLDAAERARAFVADELEAQRAWVDVADAHLAWTNGDPARATRLVADAERRADALRARWPEWAVPYRILDEAHAHDWAHPPDARVDWGSRQRAAQGRWTTGANVRTASTPQLLVGTFLVAALATLGLAGLASALLALRELRGLPVSTIAAAQPGDVKVAGTLHAPSGAAVHGPETHTEAVWWEVERYSGMKGARLQRQRSTQRFLLRDATGEVSIEPTGMQVRTRHSTTTFGSTGSSGARRVTERLLREGDRAIAIGSLETRAGGDGGMHRLLRVADGGRPLLVSNLDEAHLVRVERAWLVAGGVALVLGAALLAWIWHQRFGVTVIPGVLR